MFSIDQEGFEAVKQAYARGGRRAAIIELHKRYLALNKDTAPKVLDYILGRTTHNNDN